MSKSNNRISILQTTKDLKRIQIITIKFIRHENTVQLIGHVGQDPEKKLRRRKKISKPSIATNEVTKKTETK
jgi:hypothetical protein